MDVPPTLRLWFVADAVVDFLAAAPLLAAPELVLRKLGWTCVDPISARLVGAALLANAAATFAARDAGVETYRALLRMKAVWCLAGAASMFVAVGSGAPSAAWVFLSTFIAFAGVWLHHAIRFRQLAGAAPGDDATGDDAKGNDAKADDETTTDVEPADPSN
jgi:flagellar biosynthesis component FlhA